MVMEREQRRRLTDLYLVGTMLTIDDGYTETNSSGNEVAYEPITVYLRKLNPIDQETCLRRANAERSKVLAIRNQPESDEFQSYVAEAEGMSLDDKIALVIAEDVNKYRMAREAEIAAEDEWSDEGYLDGLLEAWAGGMNDRYAVDADDPDAKRVFEEMRRYQTIIDELVSGERDQLEEAHRKMEPDKLEELTVQKLISYASDSRWIQEYRRCELWLSVRHAHDKKSRYFESREEVDELAIQVVTRLVTAYQEMNVPVIEGKGSAATPASSDSSEQPKPVEAASISGPQG